MNFIDKFKIHHYEAAIQDIEAQIPKDNPRKEKIMKFLIREYHRRIKFLKDFDSLEKEWL